MAEIQGNSIENELRDKGKIVYRTVGGSMLPLLRECRDLVMIESVAARAECDCDAVRAELKAGDVILFKHGGRYVLHRLICIGEDEGGAVYTTYGDNCICPEHIRAGDVLGVMTEFKRDGKNVDVGDACYQRYCDELVRQKLSIERQHFPKILLRVNNRLLRIRNQKLI